jgi:ATP/maltotriose-dependent transcriptional regulator MalT
MHERETVRQAAGEQPLYAEQGARGRLEVVPGGDRGAHAGSRLAERHSQATAAALAAVRDGSLPRTNLLWAAAFLLLEAIADDVGDDPERRVSELADLLGEAKGPVSPSAEPPWPGEPLTWSETRVLRYLPTHMGAREIAAELFISANTVRTHLRHLYRKLGAHSRQEAVQRARAIGLLAVSSRRP